MAADRVIESASPVEFPKECIVCGRRTPMWVSSEFAEGRAGAFARTLLQLVVQIPLSFVFRVSGSGVRLPLCLRHHLSYGFPGMLLPVTVLILLGFLGASATVLVVFEQLSRGLILVGATLLWLFVVLTAASYAPHWSFPVTLGASRSGYLYRIAPGSHFYADERI